MSRQNYYARHQQRVRRGVDADLVEQLVVRERRTQPRLGTRKLHHLLHPELAAAGVRLGRDRFFAVLRQRQLLLEPVPAEYPCTTQSQHNLPTFANAIKDLQVKAAHEVWVSDLTYLRTAEGFLYLFLITDKWSRKIVGQHCGQSLEAREGLQALAAAVAQLPPAARPIHHSDRGSQYCCHEYVNRLQQRQLGISMTERDHCAENALAERVNGILKQEYGLGREFNTKAEAQRAVAQAIWLYNTRRPHSALGYRVPAQVHEFGLN